VGETLGNLGSRVMIASPCRRSGWSAWPAESPAGWAVPPDYAIFFTLDKCGERAQTLSHFRKPLGVQNGNPGSKGPLLLLSLGEPWLRVAQPEDEGDKKG